MQIKSVVHIGGKSFLKILNFNWQAAFQLSHVKKYEEILKKKTSQPLPALIIIQSAAAVLMTLVFFAIHSILSWTCTNKKWRRLMWNWRFCLFDFFTWVRNTVPGFIFGRLARDPHFDNVARRHRYSWRMSGFCEWPRGAVYFSTACFGGKRAFWVFGRAPSAQLKKPSQKSQEIFFRENRPLKWHRLWHSENLEVPRISSIIYEIVKAWSSDQKTTKKCPKTKPVLLPHCFLNCMHFIILHVGCAKNLTHTSRRCKICFPRLHDFMILCLFSFSAEERLYYHRIITGLLSIS